MCNDQLQFGSGWGVRRERPHYSNLLRGLQVPVDQSFGLHAVEIGHPLGALQRPAHRVGSGVEWQRLRAVQHCGERRKLRRALVHMTEDTGEHERRQSPRLASSCRAPLGPAFPSLLDKETETAKGFKWTTTT